MIGLALSGGGSRAVAFHLGCLRALNDLGILERIRVFSTISGGSVIGAYYAYTPHKSFSEFESDMRMILREGLQRKIALELFKPGNLV
jgi:NTE family protein